ncbi:MAG: hypothetical protein ACUVS4_16885 [Chloroflexaceae bacterium]
MEVRIKPFMQLLRVRPLRCHRREALEATVRVLLIARVLQERLAGELR